MFHMLFLSVHQDVHFILNSMIATSDGGHIVKWKQTEPVYLRDTSC